MPVDGNAPTSMVEFSGVGNYAGTVPKHGIEKPCEVKINYDTPK